MKRIRIAACAAAVACAGAWAQQAVVRAQPQGQAAAAAPVSDLIDGEVRKVDKGARKITLRHGEIKSLDMPPMTMVFGVARPELLDKVKPGDKVRFRATGQGGTFTVTELQPQE